MNSALAGLAILLAGPAYAFNFGFLGPRAAVVASSLLTAAIVLCLRSRRAAQEPTDWRLMGLCLALGALLVFLSGGGHVLYRTDDWTLRDAVLADLVREPWPATYFFDDRLHILRAPLGLYLLPALAGKLGGLAVADWTLAAQCALMFALVLYLVASELRDPRRRKIVLGVFILFGGMDVLPTLFLYLQGVHYRLPHLDGWGGVVVQYNAHVTLLTWVPQHALAGWAFAAAFLSWRRGGASLASLGTIFCVALFWSPLSMMGAVAMGAFALVSAAIARQIRPVDVLATLLALASVAPVLIYLTRGAGRVVSGIPANPDFGVYYVVLMLVWVAPYLLFLWSSPSGSSPTQKAEWALMAALLVALPFYSIGDNNDFTRRAAIPVIALLAARVAVSFAEHFDRGLGRRRWIVPVLMLGAVTAVAEIGRNLVVPGTPMSACNALDSWLSGHGRSGDGSTYYASADSLRPAWLFRPAGTAPVRATGTLCFGDGQRRYVSPKDPLFDPRRNEKGRP